MIPITPNGTARFSMRSPLGLLIVSSMVPTGDGNRLT